MNYVFDFSSVRAAWHEILLGCLGTIQISTMGMALAFLIGVLGVLGRRSSKMPIAFLTRTFVEIVRNTPFLVQIYFVFFALPLIGVRLDPTMTGVIALGVNGGAYAIETLRAGMDSIPRGQVEAGLALGLKPLQVFRLVIFRPALRVMYPALSSQFVILLLTSSICAAVSAKELTSAAQMIDAETFRSFEVYFTAAGIYLVMSWSLMMTLSFIERKFIAYPVR